MLLLGYFWSSSVLSTLLIYQNLPISYWSGHDTFHISDDLDLAGYFGSCKGSGVQG